MNRNLSENAIAIIVNGAGEPGEVRDGWAISFPKGEEGRYTRVHYFTDDDNKASELSERTEGSWGSSGSVDRCQLICQKPGVWSTFHPVPSTDDGASEEDIKLMRAKQAAMSKLTREERELLGL